MCTHRVCLCLLLWTLQCRPPPYCSSTCGLVGDMAPTKAGGKAGASNFAWPASHVGAAGVYSLICGKWVQLEAAGGLWFCSLKFSSISSKQYVCHQIHPSQPTGAAVVLNLTCLQLRSWQQMMKCSMCGEKWKTRKKKKMNKRKSFFQAKSARPLSCLKFGFFFFFSLKNAFNKKKIKKN